MLSDTFGDIVVAHSGEGKLDIESDNDSGNGGQVGDVSGAVTTTIALMTIILAIIFL